MKKLILYLMTCILLLSYNNVVYCDEGTFSVCSIVSYSISYDESLSCVYLPCTGNAQSLYLNVVDPCTLQIYKTYQFDGLIQDAYAIDNSSKLLIILSELDGNSSTEEGKLVEIDYAAGNTLRSLNLDRSPEVMRIDPSENYAYVALGLMDPYISGDIIKISLSTFQIVDETVFGDDVDDMAISPDGSKLYVKTENIYWEHPSVGIWGIGVFDTSDLELISRFPVLTSPSEIELNSDGSRLYIGSHNYERTDSGADIYVVDTSTNTIINKLRFFHNDTEMGTSCLQYSCITNKLYCTAAPDIDGIFEYSNLIMELDLYDYSYSFFEMGSSDLGLMTLAEDANMCRLFAIETEGTPVVHYMDVP